MTAPLMFQDRRIPLVLASTSHIRARLLENAGLRFDVVAPQVDEASVRQTLNTDGQGCPPSDVAVLLAGTKAMAVSQVRPEAIVIGADQVLDLEGTILEKPRSREDAQQQLLALRNRRHALISAVACARDGNIIWSHDDTAILEMRDFSLDFLARYLEQVGDEVQSSVGGYKLEAEGIHLFSSIRGDYFTILGLPLLPLLAYLRSCQVIVD